MNPTDTTTRVRTVSDRVSVLDIYGDVTTASEHGLSDACGGRLTAWSYPTSRSRRLR
jgi:hypothetical protein